MSEKLTYEELEQRVRELEQEEVKRKQEERRKALKMTIQDAIKQTVVWKDSIEKVLNEIKEFTGFEAVAIRLQEGEDFPYYLTQGFPVHFVEAERYLCTRDSKGEIVRDFEGNPFTECMCGNIICERTDASKDFFTKGGSFWSNNTSKLLAETTEEDRQTRTRNRCNSEGYESVGLIPLKAGHETLGLIQLNDTRTNLFTEDMIQFFEDIGILVGNAFSRKLAEEALIKSEYEKSMILDNTTEIITYHDVNHRIKWANKAYLKSTGLSLAEVKGQKCYEVWGFTKICNNCPVSVAIQSGEPCESELTPQNQEHWPPTQGSWLSRAASVKDNEGKTIGAIEVSYEITQRKQAEAQIKTTLKEKEILLAEIHHRVKNNMQLIISLLCLQQQHSGESNAGSLDDIINRVRIFGDIHRRLYQQEDISRIDFVQHLKDNLQDLVEAYNVNKNNIELELNISNPNFQLDQAVSCGLLFNELISNSLKHAFSNQGKISISITNNSDGEPEKIVYSDNGKGINTESGGFGTKIIYALAEQLNMCVQISSKGGTLFEFTKKSIGHVIGKPIGEILYVEDELIIALDKTTYLKENGYSVNENIITSGEKAVKYVEELTPKPSLIFMDIKLKGEMNGIEAARKIRQDNPSIPIVFLSGYEDKETQGNVSTIPNTSFLNKLCPPEKMKEIIDKYQK
ncbi:MAG: response regulator [Deltaproteobacteria bacterium]|nr:response regulator [Deltaproteobacteria bacterium]